MSHRLRARNELFRGSEVGAAACSEGVNTITTTDFFCPRQVASKKNKWIEHGPLVYMAGVTSYQRVGVGTAATLYQREQTKLTPEIHLYYLSGVYGEEEEPGDHPAEITNASKQVFLVFATNMPFSTSWTGGPAIPAKDSNPHCTTHDALRCARFARPAPKILTRSGPSPRESPTNAAVSSAAN